MQTENWKKVKELLDEVLELDHDARAEFLSRAAVSDEIRAEVESLLDFEDEAENLMNLPVIEFSRDFFSEDEPSALIGAQIGAYQIIREIGHGGMGAVFLAERNDGKFEQKVAFKLLKREMNTAALRRRFQQERHILASLEHPNIARLLDAGATSDKVPYLAMEYIEGLPIDDYCDKHQLDLGQRLDLFRQVCTAVDFAHRNLVVHRDLKPSNILVNQEGIPKLLDFGISKILSGSFEQEDMATVTRVGAMTPGYASPEQLKRESVSTATDIYSLGVILYELLSGHRPFEEKEHDLREIYNAVLETDPLPPSALIEAISKRIKTETEAKTVLKPAAEPAAKDKPTKLFSDTKAGQIRYTLPNTVTLTPHSLRGDLDNIVLKALRKEPERRYSSAENLAEDIHRHQRGLPVTARPNTFSYRAEKFYKRNRVGVFAGVLIILTVIGGVAATLWQTRTAQAERAKAERRFGDVRKLANSYLYEIFPEIEDLEGSIKAREKILKTAMEYLDSLSKEAEGDLELQMELAMAYEKIGEVQGAATMPNLGDINAGLESFKKAQKLRESVFSVNPGEIKNKDLLSRNYQVTAQTLMWNIDTALASEYFEKAIKLRRELVREKPESPDLQNRLAVMISDYAAIAINNVENEKALKLLDESAQILKETMKNHPEHFNTRKAYPRVLRAYSKVKANLGDYDGALKDIEESIALTTELIKQKSDDYALKRTAWLNDSHVCEIFVVKRDGPKIVETCLKTVDFNLKTLEKEPDESFALYDLAITHYNIAQGYRLSNKPQLSIEFAQKALAPIAKLSQISPGINDYERAVAVIENEIADSLIMLGKPEDALTHLQIAAEKLEKVVQTDKTVTSYQFELAKIYRSTAAAYGRLGDRPRAAEFADKAVPLVRKLKETNSLRQSDNNLLEELEREKAEYGK